MESFLFSAQFFPWDLQVAADGIELFVVLEAMWVLVGVVVDVIAAVKIYQQGVGPECPDEGLDPAEVIMSG